MKYCFIFCTTLFTSLFSTIIELPSFSELEKYVDQETILLLDIDDTLISPVQMLGNDTWFNYRYRQLSQVSDPNHALEKALAEWEAIRHLSTMELVEKSIPEVLFALQRKNIPIMGLTIQGLSLATRTVLQLKEFLIDLSETCPFMGDCCFAVDQHTVLFRGGIIFTSGKSKADALFKLCKLNHAMPKKIVMVDDKYSHLKTIEEEAEKRAIAFTGLRYGGSDQKKKAFKAEIADYQLKNSTLLRILTDEEALSAMQSGG